MQVSPQKFAGKFPPNSPNFCLRIIGRAPPSRAVERRSKQKKLPLHFLILRALTSFLKKKAIFLRGRPSYSAAGCGTERLDFLRIFDKVSSSTVVNILKKHYKKNGASAKKIGIYNQSGSFKLGYGVKNYDAFLNYMYYDNFLIGLKRKANFISKIPIPKEFSQITRRGGEIG